MEIVGSSLAEQSVLLFIARILESNAFTLTGCVGNSYCTDFGLLRFILIKVQCYRPGNTFSDFTRIHFLLRFQDNLFAVGYLELHSSSIRA